MAPVIEVSDLRKSYGDTERLHGITFTVEAGQIFGFLGPNGAGKTTTIEILEGYRQRSSGEVSVLGVDPGRATRPWRNRIGLVLQESELDPVYTVRETVSMFARYFEAPSPIDAILEAAGLTDKADDRIGRLSGGQRRRVDVALGLVGDPEVLFLDEPTTGLDPTARRGMWSMIEGLREAGKTVFLTTHYMDEAEHLCDDIVILRAGWIAAQGSPEELSRNVSQASKISFVLPGEISPSDLEAVLGPKVSHLDGVVELVSGQVQRDLSRLLGWAEEEGIELAHLQVTQPTLDDVFIELVGSHKEDEGGEHRE